MSCAAHQITQSDCHWCKTGSNRNHKIMPIMKPTQSRASSRLTYSANQDQKGHYTHVKMNKEVVVEEQTVIPKTVKFQI